MSPASNDINKISYKELWRPFIARVPLRYRPAIIQKEIEWSGNFLKGMLALWTAWFVGLTIASDLQKAPEMRNLYVGIRLIVVAVSLAVQFYLRKQSRSRKAITFLTLFLASLYLSAYLAFSFFPLPIRTTWVTILPAAFILTTPRSGRAAVASYAILMTAGLLVFRQPINSIWVVSDILFGFVLIGGGLIVKDLWVKSIVLLLDQEEAQRLSMQNEIKILEAVENFIPRGIRSRIRDGISKGSSISEVIETMSTPTKQFVAMLYSDYRNYSRQSASINFIKNELITSSQPIIDYSEQQLAIVQNRGDSLLAAFLDADQAVLAARALYAGLMSSKAEHDRVLKAGKKCPDRYMIVTSGSAVFCSLGNEARQEITIAGKPANLAARLDELTKNPKLKTQIDLQPCVIFDFATKNLLNSIELNLDWVEIDLKSESLEVRTYHEEKRIFLLHYSELAAKKLSDYLNKSEDRSEAA